MTSAPSHEQRFDWPLCQLAEELVLQRLESFVERNAFARSLSHRMRDETGTLLIDWVDHLVLPASDEKPFRAAGYTDDPLADAPAGQHALWHPEAMLPRILLAQNAGPMVLALRVESVSVFLFAHGLSLAIEGVPLSRYRWACITEEKGARLDVVERRGYRGFVHAGHAANALEAQLDAQEWWRHRQRQFADDAEGWRHTHELLDRLIALTGRDLACHIVFAEERTFWQSRNRAACVQKARQDRLGLGWANHDHHTFRSSRRHFVDLMRALEKLGFERRERYYTGKEAGWGAQILEQSHEDIVAFCDVDLLPEETELDFSREQLPPSSKLGTIGLWVGLHGESFVQAGMHHLECRFDHELLQEQLEREGVKTMKPFSDLPFLWQAFTEGERWPVKRERAQRLHDAGLVDDAQLRQFMQEGAIGSHLENLQRKGGFKGFNQKSVSAIIAVTDPRKQMAH
ncbi:MAG TPA: hypothetical protein DDZ88_15485 [Verrucomicrobiales bacterium]|nr:hypothetical protein [Verrucomicrobiales bacterium]